MAYVVNPPGPGPARLSDLDVRAVGGQPDFALDDLERFVAAPRVAVLAYTRRDGRPGQSPIWYAYRDGQFHCSTVTGSPKALALARDPRVCLTIQDERPPYRAVLVDGIAHLAPLDAADPPEPTADLATRYLGRVAAKAYDALTAETYAEQGLTALTIQPTAVRGFDNRSALGLGERVWLRLRGTLPVPRRWL